MAYPPKNLKLPAIVVHLLVGFTNNSDTVRPNFVKVDGYGPSVGGFCGPPNAFLFGSLNNTRLRIPSPPPMIPIMANAHLQPALAIINVESEASAPPR